MIFSAQPLFPMVYIMIYVLIAHVGPTAVLLDGSLYELQHDIIVCYMAMQEEAIFHCLNYNL